MRIPPIYESIINGHQIKIDKEFLPSIDDQIEIEGEKLTVWIKKNYIALKEGKEVIIRISIGEELNKIMDVIFKAIRDIEKNLKDPVLSNHIADHFFLCFKKVWNPFFQFYKTSEQIELRNDLLFQVKKWENDNNFHIKKGTPYLLNARNYFLMHNLDMGFNFIYLAIEDEKIHGIKENPLHDYHNSHAFAFASLNIDKRDNPFYRAVNKHITIIKTFLRDSNVVLTFEDFKKKFLDNYAEFEDEILFFTYIYYLFYFEIVEEIMFELPNNEFARMRNLTKIFSFCLLLDKIMAKKTKEKYMSGNTRFLVEKMTNSISDNDWIDLRRNLKHKPDILDVKDVIEWHFNEMENGVIYLPSQPEETNRMIINSMLVYYLRNKGGHKLKLDDLTFELFWKIRTALFNQVFIVVKYLL